MKTFAIGDIHGNYRGLLQCLEKSSFDKQTDKLIVLGDVADGWPEVVECVDELLTIENMIPIEGNHDTWCYEWMKFGTAHWLWVTQGGQATLDSYLKQPNKVQIHLDQYFSKMNPYYIDELNNAYVHGGYTYKEGLGHNILSTYTWDRTLWEKAKSAKTQVLNMTKMYNKVFIGHTSLGWTLPEKNGNVWNLDCGGGWEGALCIMNVETEEYFLSDKTSLLYPEVKGRE
jgi:serine/threonine protein phosphatase 1